uniref:Recep_L_domain domain-containing protein n=1 Tax=Caenorhabditis tropicalis TaxID=1561998 RepID=A0A1I7TDB5_9PELO
MCSVIHDVFFNRRFISGNLFDCGCDINEPFKWPMIKNFPSNCIVLYGNLIFEGNAPPFEVLYRLSTVNSLFGFIQVKNTNLETLGFLQNLQDIESDVKTLNGVYEGGLAIGFRRNDFLEDVSFPSLRIAFQSIKFRMNENLTMDGNFCAKISNGLKRTLVGLNADYDCRYMITTDSS